MTTSRKIFKLLNQKAIQRKEILNTNNFPKSKNFLLSDFILMIVYIFNIVPIDLLYYSKHNDL